MLLIHFDLMIYKNDVYIHSLTLIISILSNPYLSPTLRQHLSPIPDSE